jgi:hypothetical protein
LGKYGEEWTNWVPLAWFLRLLHASLELSHKDALDEYISVAGLLNVCGDVTL